MSLGDTLRRAREARRISLNQAALETRIRQTVIEALEDNDFAALPPRPFLRGLLRNYALYLHLDADTVLDEYDVETGQKPSGAARPTQILEARLPSANTDYTPAPNTFPSPPEESPEEFTFPPFQVASRGTRDSSSPTTGGVSDATSAPAHETVFQVAPEIASDESAPKPPLNLSQEPPTLGQRIGGTRIPEAVAIISLAVALFTLVSVGFTALQNFTIPFGNLPTPPATEIPTATIPPGSTPTGIPTLPQTLEAPTPVAGLIESTATVSATIATGAIEPTQIILATPTLDVPADAQMTLDVQANSEIGAWIIVDEDEVFNGTLKNETRTFTAHARLFIQIKNIGNGRVFFQGTRILPRNQQERSELNRAWLMSPLGIPVIVPPTPYPSPVAPTDFPTRTLVPTETSTPTLTSAASITPTLTSTPSGTFTPTQTLTRTATLALTTTRTRTISASATATRATTATNSSTQTPTATPTR